MVRNWVALIFRVFAVLEVVEIEGMQTQDERIQNLFLS